MSLLEINEDKKKINTSAISEFNAHVVACIKLALEGKMCLSIGIPKTINFAFVPNGKLMIFRCPNIRTV